MSSNIKVMKLALLLCLISLSMHQPVSKNTADKKPKTIAVVLQKRVKAAGSDTVTIVKEKQQWKAAQTAIIICDMWNQHWCKGATARVKEMAPHMNNVLNAAREKGILIVHAPSECMDHYKDHPGRKLAAKYAATQEISDGVSLLPSEQGATWPVDQSNGGCNDTPRCEQHNPWTKETELIDIKDGDAISDAGNEIAGLLRDRNIDRVILMGVHTNMCIVNRTFGMRNMKRYGMQVVLMRDMTDAMYDSRQAPFANHFQGLGLVIGYIETYIAPTMLSSDITGGKPFRFAGDVRRETGDFVAGGSSPGPSFVGTTPSGGG